jgi:hypothetical protein
MAKSRKVSSISKEFDGKEVQGKLIERSGLFGSKVSKEVFKMPSGGKHIEKTRTNKKGDVVSRLSRDTKVNPLKLFNDNKQQAIKKAGGEMSAYKKSLKKFQGDKTGSQVNSTANDSIFNSSELDLFNNRINNTPPAIGKIQGVRQDVGFGVDPGFNSKSIIEKPKTTKGIVAGQEMEFTPEQMKSIFGIQKRGGSVKRKKK